MNTYDTWTKFEWECMSRGRVCAPLACFSSHLHVYLKSGGQRHTGFNRLACAQSAGVSAPRKFTWKKKEQKKKIKRKRHALLAGSEPSRRIFTQRTGTSSYSTHRVWLVPTYVNLEWLTMVTVLIRKSLSSPPSNILLKCLFYFSKEHRRHRRTGSDTRLRFTAESFSLPWPGNLETSRTTLFKFCPYIWIIIVLFKVSIRYCFELY